MRGTESERSVTIQFELSLMIFLEFVFSNEDGPIGNLKPLRALS